MTYIEQHLASIHRNHVPLQAFGMSDKEVSDGNEYDEDWEAGSQSYVNDVPASVQSMELTLVNLKLEKDDNELLDGPITLESTDCNEEVPSSSSKCSLRSPRLGSHDGKYYSELLVSIHGKRYGVQSSIFDGPNIASRRVTLYLEKCKKQEAKMQRERDQVWKKSQELRQSIKESYQALGVVGISAKKRLQMYQFRRRRIQRQKEEHATQERNNRWYYQRTRPSHYNAKKEAAKYIQDQRHATHERSVKEQAFVSRIERNQRKLCLKSKRLIENCTTGNSKGSFTSKSAPINHEYTA